MQLIERAVLLWHILQSWFCKKMKLGSSSKAFSEQGVGANLGPCPDVPTIRLVSKLLSCIGVWS